MGKLAMELNQITGGIKYGELAVFMAGRQTGKSYLQKILKNSFYGTVGNQFAHIKPPPPELHFDEGRVHGSRYYTVRPVWYDWPELETWCRETFGEPGDVWPNEDFTWPECPRWIMNNGKFWFRNERDRSWFIMRWT